MKKKSLWLSEIQPANQGHAYKKQKVLREEFYSVSLKKKKLQEESRILQSALQKNKQKTHKKQIHRTQHSSGLCPK